MKTRELIALLERQGFVLVRAQKHYVFQRNGVNIIVPRHKDCNFILAKKIIKQIENEVGK